jgi:hypothetical protein
MNVQTILAVKGADVATIGKQAFTGISNTTQEQLDLFGALELPTP